MPNTNDRFVALRSLKHGPKTYHAGELLPEDFGVAAHRTIDALLSNGDVQRAVTVTEPASNPDDSNASGEGAGSSASEDNESGNTEENTEGEGNDASGDSTNGEGEGEGEQSEPADPKVTPSGYAPEDHTVEEVVAYVEENPDERDEVIAAEEAGKGRKTILAQLRVEPPAAD